MIPELNLVSCGGCEYQVALQVRAQLLPLAELLLLPACRVRVRVRVRVRERVRVRLLLPVQV